MQSFNRSREEGRRRLQMARADIRNSIYGFCPVQAEFVFDNMGAYFRARGGEWELTIAGPFGLHVSCQQIIDAAIDAAFDDHQALAAARGADPWDGWMPHREAEALIVKTLRRWVRSGLTIGVV